MKYLLVLAASTAISLLVIPVMERYAVRLGMIDEPNGRKVHVRPIPRVGGWGIVLGALVPIVLMGSFDRLLISYLLGGLVLFIFGTLDDRKEMGHYAKFVGQFLAVLPVVTYGGLYVESLPFLWPEPLPAAIGMPFTMVAMIGVINAMNHSDGLDGLAGGESLLSLVAMLYMAHLAKGDLAILIAVGAIGGGLGFLRYNTHPASVFMGDGGSQFLGFTLGFLAVLLTQRVDPSLSPAVVLLVLGLPIADISVVLYKRITSGMNWFRATRNHVHHRLLELGFIHHHSVVIIYSAQTLLVVAAIYLRNGNDWAIIFLYLIACAGSFALLAALETSAWRPRNRNNALSGDGRVDGSKNYLLVVAPRRFLDLALPLYLIVGALTASRVPTDFGYTAAVVIVLLLGEALLSQALRSTVHRALIYVTVVFILYLHNNFPPVDAAWLQPVELTFFTFMALAVATCIRYSPGRRQYEFHTTALDFLMMFLIPIVVLVSLTQLETGEKSLFVVKLAILLYACELQVIEKRLKWNLLTLAIVAAATIVMIRGIY